MEKKETIIFFLKEYRFAKRYFAPLIHSLSNEFEILIIHTSELEKSIDIDLDYKNVDVSYYSNKEVVNILINNDVRSVFITNIRSLLDIYIMIICNIFKINLVYIEHGLTLNKISVFKKSNIKHSIEKYINYSFKVFSLLFSTNNKKGVFSKFYKSFINNNYNLIRLDGALLYSNYSKNVLEKLFDFSNTIIQYSGYPISQTTSGIEELKSAEEKKQIVFIHQPLIVDNFQNLSYSAEVELFNEIDSLVKNYNYKFILKLHPRSDLKFFNKNFRGNIIFDEISSEKLIAESEIVIGYFSTALIPALILNKKLLIFKEKNISTDEINVFATETNSFVEIGELNVILEDLRNSKTELKKLNYQEITGEHNTIEDRYHKTLLLLNKLNYGQR